MATPTPEGANMPLRFEAAARGSIAIIVVGPERVKYHVHKAVLVEHSEYFKKALQGPWKEAEEGVVYLHDVETEICKFILHRETQGSHSQSVSSLTGYSQKLPAEVRISDVPKRVHCQITWLKAYLFGDRILAHGFVKAFRHGLVHRFSKHQRLYYETVIYGWKNLDDTDTLRQMIVDVHVWDSPNGEVEEDEELRNQLPLGFLLAVRDRFADVVDAYEEDYDPILPRECDYHGHATDQERTECEEEAAVKSCC